MRVCVVRAQGSGQERVCREGGERRRGEDARAWSAEPRALGTDPHASDARTHTDPVGGAQGR